MTALNDGDTPAAPSQVTHRHRRASSTRCVRIDTPGEADYYRHGGILQYVLRKMLAELKPPTPRR